MDNWLMRNISNLSMLNQGLTQEFSDFRALASDLLKWLIPCHGSRINILTWPSC